MGLASILLSKDSVMLNKVSFPATLSITAVLLFGACTPLETTPLIIWLSQGQRTLADGLPEGHTLELTIDDQSDLSIERFKTWTELEAHTFTLPDTNRAEYRLDLIDDTRERIVATGRHGPRQRIGEPPRIWFFEADTPLALDLETRGLSTQIQMCSNGLGQALILDGETQKVHAFDVNRTPMIREIASDIDGLTDGTCFFLPETTRALVINACHDNARPQAHIVYEIALDMEEPTLSESTTLALDNEGSYILVSDDTCSLKSHVQDDAIYLLSGNTIGIISTTLAPRDSLTRDGQLSHATFIAAYDGHHIFVDTTSSTIHILKSDDSIEDILLPISNPVLLTTQDPNDSLLTFIGNDANADLQLMHFDMSSRTPIPVTDAYANIAGRLPRIEGTITYGYIDTQTAYLFSNEGPTEQVHYFSSTQDEWESRAFATSPHPFIPLFGADYIQPRNDESDDAFVVNWLRGHPTP